jgi:hypothetical protein
MNTEYALHDNISIAVVANKPKTVVRESPFLPVHDIRILGMRRAISAVHNNGKRYDDNKPMAATRLTKSSVRVCSLQLPIIELSHFRCLVAVDIVVGDRSNRDETPSLRSEAMVIVIKEGK